MRRFIEACLKFKLLILAIAIGALSFGVIQLRSSPVDVLPEFTPPYAEIQTEALGLSAEEVEELITVPLEANMLNGVEGVDIIRSESVPGLSSIVLVFAEGTDIYRARQLVGERLTQAVALPRVSKPPTLLQPLSSSNRVVMIGLSSDELSAIEQSVIASWTMRPRLMGVPGVANVSIWGMRDQQLQVQVDPERLRAQGVTLSEVIRSTGNAQVVSPLSFLEASTPGTGGFIETPQQRLQVRHLLEKLADPAELGKVPVIGTNGRLRLSDVADIKVDHQPLIGDAVVANGPGLMLVVEKFPGVSTTEVTEGVQDALETLRPGLTGLTADTTVFQPAKYIHDALDNLGVAFLIGGALMLLGMLALRFHWRAVLIALLTVPLSLVTAGLLLRLFGQGFNALVLAGLAAAVAVVVDEAVAPTHRVMSHLGQHHSAGAKVSVATVVAESSQAVRRPLMYATAIVLLAIVPVAALDGRPGDFFSPMVVAYAVAIVAALLVALTVTPGLTVLLFSRWKASPRKASSWPSRADARYSRLLQRFSRQPPIAAIAVTVLALIGLLTLPFLSMSLVPNFRDQNVLVRLHGAPGTSNVRMTQIASELVGRLEAVDGVGGVGAHIGRAVTGDRVTNVDSADLWVNIDSGSDYDRIIDAIESEAEQVQGADHEVLTYSEQKMRDVGALLHGENLTVGNDLNLLTGLDTPLAVRLYGQDPKVLAVEAPKVRDLMASVEGVADPRVLLPPTQPSIEIEVDLAKAQALGVTPGDVRRAEATLLQGIQVGSVFEQQKVFDVIVQGVPSTRADVDSIRNLLMDRPGGGYLRLGDVADVRIVDTPTVIQREAVSRRLDIVAGVNGSSTADVAAALERQLPDLKLPLGYHAEVVQDSTQQEIGAGRMLFYGIGALIAVFLLLQAAFRSWRLAGLVLATLPLSLVGGLLVVLLTGGELTIGALIGLLAVLGLAVRHALLWPAVKVDLVSPLLEGEARSLKEHRTAADVGAGVRERFSSTMITTVALALLMLPFAILGPRPGLEILHPMALVVLGALVTSSIVTLFVVPAIFLHFPPRSRVDHDLEDALNEREAAGRPPQGADRKLTPGSANGGANGHSGNGHLVGAQVHNARAGQPHRGNGQSVGKSQTPRVPATLGAESDEPAK